MCTIKGGAGGFGIVSISHIVVTFNARTLEWVAAAKLPPVIHVFEANTYAHVERRNSYDSKIQLTELSLQSLDAS